MILNNRIWLHAPAILAAASALYAGIAWGARSALPWLVVAVVALAVAWWVERRLARPLARLGEAARQLVEGGDIGPLGEVGEARPLAEALNTIDARLTSQDKEIATLKDAKRQALTELQSAEERYVAAVSGADDGLWDWDLRTDAVYYSPRLLSMLGLETAGTPGKLAAWLDRVNGNDLPVLRAALDAHLAGRTPTLLAEHRLRRGDGEIWVQARGRAIRSASGKPIRLVGLITDISVRKRAEEILRGMAEGVATARGEAFYHALVKSFAQVLRVKAAFMTQCLDPEVKRVRTLAFWDGQQFRDALEYDLDGTPCDTVINQGQACFIANGLGARYPKEAGFESYLGIPIFDHEHRVIGHLACLGALPMDDPLPHEPIFSVFASRAGIEMEYMAVAGKLAAA